MRNTNQDAFWHLGEDREKYFNSIAPPIIQSSNFVFKTIEEFREKILSEEESHVYTRGNNPTTEILRRKLAALEHTEDALITSSGASAIACSVLANVKSGDHVICVQKPYSWTYKLFSEFLENFQVQVTYVDGTSNEKIKNALRSETKMLYLESPNSLTFELQDLKWCAQFAKENDLITIIDNSYSSPIYQCPADFGIDIIVHSGTKYINGHSDVVVGSICSSNKQISKIFSSPFMTLGVNISPHDAWLVLRGLRTLEMRINKSHETAMKLVDDLYNHPKINQVIYPYHHSFPQFTLAKQQMSGCGGLFTVVLKAEKKEQVSRFIHALKNIVMAVSWGGYESLVIPSLIFHDMPGREDSAIPWTYVRFYVGIEDYDYLKSDIFQALEKL